MSKKVKQEMYKCICGSVIKNNKLNILKHEQSKKHKHFFKNRKVNFSKDVDVKIFTPGKKIDSDMDVSSDTSEEDSEDEEVEDSETSDSNSDEEDVKIIRFKDLDGDDEEYVDFEIQSLLNSKIFKNNPKLKQNLADIIVKADEEEPNLIELINSDFSIDDKVDIMNHIEIYKNCPKYTDEWLHIRKRIKKMIRDAKINTEVCEEYNENEMKNFSQQLEKFESSLDSYKTLKYKIVSLDTNEHNKRIIFEKYNSMNDLSIDDDEYHKLLNWVKWALSIPYNRYKTISFTPKGASKYLQNISKKLDENFYGMNKIKQDLMLFINTKLTNPHISNCNLCLKGPPGVGKTSIARFLSEILEFPFEQISCTSITNKSYIRGHGYTYIGSEPGQIIKCMKKMKYNNGILFFDEFDKIFEKEGLENTFLDIIDPSQNSEYNDIYLSELKIDISQLWFIFSINNTSLNSALMDRMYVIDVPGYSHKEKVNILKNHVFPKLIKRLGFKEKDITVSKDICSYFINKIQDKTQGIRYIEKKTFVLLNKILFIRNNQNVKFPNMGFKTTSLKFPMVLGNELVDDLVKHESQNDISSTFMYT